MLHKKYVNRGFTLVELLAVIVILAIILVIAVPKIMDVINSSKKSTLETSVKMIASAAEKTKMQNTVLGKENEEIKCNSVAKLSSSDYENCTIKFDGNTAKVTVKGKGKFEGLNICGGTKNSATAQEENCPPPFATDSWETIIAAVQSGEYPYKVGDTKEVELSNDLGTHTLRIANTTPCSDVEVDSKTACGFVLEFIEGVGSSIINSSDTNVGSWPASKMRAYINDTIYNALTMELKNAIIDTYVVSGHGSSDTSGTLANNNFESIDKLYLLSPEEIYADWSTNGSEYDTAKGTSRQLDYYGSYTEGVTAVTTISCERAIKTSKYQAYVLRSAFGSNYFADVYYPCSASNIDADWGAQLIPAFRLSD